MRLFSQLYGILWGIILMLWSSINFSNYDSAQKYAFTLIFIVGVIIFLLGIKKINEQKKTSIKDIILTIITILYIGVESLINFGNYDNENNLEIFEPNSGFGYFNHPAAKYDTVRGYRWDKGKHRIYKFHPGQNIYDNTFTINEQGYYYKNDFSFLKKDSTFRWLIFGDSFTASEYLPTSLSDILDSMAKSHGLNMEFYPIALNGAGIVNWHRIYFHEIVPHYEFDGVIFNIFANDLRRSFFIMHHTDTMGYTAWLDEVPKDVNDLFEKHKDRLQPYAPFLDDSMMDIITRENSMQIESSKPLNFYLLNILIHLPKIIIEYKNQEDFRNKFFIKRNKPFSMSDYERENGDRGKKLILDIINDLKVKGYPVLIAQMPYNLGIQYYQKGYNYTDKLYIKHFVDSMNIPYYDGEQIFYPLVDSLDNYFFKADIHWNERGAKLYSQKFIQYLKDNRNQFYIP